jgi:CheY-like chemotaxis protein
MANVLMIDDDKDMCDEMSEILESDGIEVTAISDPVKGMKLAEGKKYDLLILDLKMPEITGYDILHRVKALDKKIKVMVMTGAPLKKIVESELMDEDKLRNEILELADEVVNKSADIQTILEKIRGLCEKSQK